MNRSDELSIYRNGKRGYVRIFEDSTIFAKIADIKDTFAITSPNCTMLSSQGTIYIQYDDYLAMLWDNFALYSGSDFRNLKENDIFHGCMYYESGEIYRGEFIMRSEGKIEKGPFGEYRYNDGKTSYIGNFRGDQRNGLGILIDRGRVTVKKGLWRRDICEKVFYEGVPK